MVNMVSVGRVYLPKQESIDSIILGETISFGLDLHFEGHGQKTSCIISSAQITGEKVLDAHLLINDYGTAVELIDRSFQKRRSEWRAWKPSPFEKLLETISAEEARDKYAQTVKTSVLTLLEIGRLTMDDQYVVHALNILRAYESDKTRKKTEGLPLTDDFAKFAHKRFLPLAPTVEALAKYVVRAYIRERNYEFAISAMKGTPLASYAQKAVDAAQRPAA